MGVHYNQFTISSVNKVFFILLSKGKCSGSYAYVVHLYSNFKIARYEEFKT